MLDALPFPVPPSLRAGAVQRGDALALLLAPEGEFVRGIGAP